MGIPKKIMHFLRFRKRMTTPSVPVPVQNSNPEGAGIDEGDIPTKELNTIQTEDDSSVYVDDIPIGGQVTQPIYEQGPSTSGAYNPQNNDMEDDDDDWLNERSPDCTQEPQPEPKKPLR